VDFPFQEYQQRLARLQEGMKAAGLPTLLIHQPQNIRFAANFHIPAVRSKDMPVMRAFFQTAPMIYAAVARLAAENGAPAQIETLRESQTSFRAAAAGENPRDMAIFNHRFHETIGEMAGNPYLTPSLSRLQIDHARMSQAFYDARSKADRQRIATACDQHDAMIGAFEAREPARAVELTLDHWALSRDRIERFVQPDPLPLDPGTEMRDAI